MIRLDKNNFIPWISVVLLFFAYSIGTGLYITIHRVTYYPIFESKIVSVLLTIFSSSLMTLYNYKRYVFLVPLSLLSFLSVSLTPLIISIFILHELRKVDRTVSIIFLVIDASMLSWLILRILLGVNTYFSFPLMILEAGAPMVIPFIWFGGVIFSIYKRDLSSKSQLLISPLIPFIVVLLISLIPYFPFVNPYKFPETVDFKYYYSWLLTPTFSGWFFYSRPLYLMLLYILSLIFKPYTVAYYEFVFLSVFYVYSAYKLASALDKSIASLSALLASVSPMLITFLYSGLEANLFSISLMYISMSYLIKREKLGLAILFSLLSMFSHIYAWAQLSAAISLYYILKSIIRKSRPDNYTLTYLSFSIPFIAIGFFLILSGVFPVPMGLLNYNQLVYQIAVVSWGSNNALLYFLLSSFGNKYVKEGVLNFVYSISVFGIIFLSPATNLIIDLPLFIPAAYAIRNIDRQSVSVLLLLGLILWGIYMSINSVPMLS
ncbi:hypothetical protein GFS03_02170 [Sulfolobus sp. E5-1-F]|uniref:hypothetical protein n=1 Tax=Sulfolobaceae TaxID=118883 RepID=UPI001297200A|nr:MULTISPECIES: hypothetical protein [unclassified Sulfolobus]QGA53477.1 hypothetical protein GFS03_02170 [Sulfolobus sp. E5-1-F]QGA68849.1 hypothetical protein GFS33_09055 [Sulfolobus sp. E11-6]